MRYVLATLEEENKTLAYRFYISDSLFYQAQNKMLNVRYEDLITPKKVDNRTGDEIALDVVIKLNLRID